jgi:hypothetical protein
VYKYAEITQSLPDLAKKEQCGNGQKKAFAKLNLVLSAKSVFRIYDLQAITELHTDSSNKKYGVILIQKNEGESKFQSITIIQRRLTQRKNITLMN